MKPHTNDSIFKETEMTISVKSMKGYGIFFLSLLLCGCSSTDMIQKSREKYQAQQAELKKADEEAMMNGVYLDGNIVDDMQAAKDDSKILEKWSVGSSDKDHR